jgi:hypothetical protein
MLNILIKEQRETDSAQEMVEEIESLRAKVAACEKERDDAITLAALNYGDLQNAKQSLAICEKERDELRGTLFQRCCDVAASQHYAQQLRDALGAMLTHMGMDEDEWNKPTFDQARKALSLHHDTTALDALVKDAERRKLALMAIKGLVCGEASPNWDHTPRTYATRGVIADICDAAIDAAKDTPNKV